MFSNAGEEIEKGWKCQPQMLAQSNGRDRELKRLVVSDNKTHPLRKKTGSQVLNTYLNAWDGEGEILYVTVAGVSFFEVATLLKQDKCFATNKLLTLTESAINLFHIVRNIVSERRLGKRQSSAPTLDKGFNQVGQKLV